MKIIFLICEKYLLRCVCLRWLFHHLKWRNILMKIRWFYLQWYKMCFRKVKHFWRPSSCDVTVLFLNWVQSTGWKLKTTLGVQSDLLLWIIPSNENRVRNWDDILSNENHVHNNFWLRYFFKNTVIGPYKSAPNQINQAKQSKENRMSILLIFSVI